MLICIPQLSFATTATAQLDNSPMSRVLCNVFQIVTGDVGKAIVVFAIIAAGFGFFAGKFSIALIIGITLGIGILFGAPKIVEFLSGENTVSCETVTTGVNDCFAKIEVQSSGGDFPFTGISSSLSEKKLTVNGTTMEVARITCPTGKLAIQYKHSYHTPTQIIEATEPAPSTALAPAPDYKSTVVRAASPNPQVELTYGYVPANIIFKNYANAKYCQATALTFSVVDGNPATCTAGYTSLGGASTKLLCVKADNSSLAASGSIGQIMGSVNTISLPRSTNINLPAIPAGAYVRIGNDGANSGKVYFFAKCTSGGANGVWSFASGGDPIVPASTSSTATTTLEFAVDELSNY